MNQDFPIAGLGTIVVDHQAALDRYPEADTKNAIREARLQTGGPVPTALAMLRRLGCDCGFVGAWGSDPMGNLISLDLSGKGIRFQNACPDGESSTGFAQVWIDAQAGTRTIVSKRGPEFPLDELARRMIHSACLLHLDGWPSEAALQAAKLMKGQKGKVILDAGNLKPGMADLIPLADVVNCPRRFLRQFFESNDPIESALKLLAMGPSMVTVTDGEQGAYLCTRTEQIHQPAYAVAVKDSNGAGDVFCGGLIYGFLQGWESKALLQFAAAGAALKCKRLGNWEALPSREEIESFMFDRGQTV